MEKVEIEVEKLLTLLKNSMLVEEFLTWKEKVKENQELLFQIKQYQKTNDEAIKKKLYQDKTYQTYLEKESNLRILLFGMNLQFRKLKEKKRCELSKESTKDVI